MLNNMNSSNQEAFKNFILHGWNRLTTDTSKIDWFDELDKTDIQLVEQFLKEE